MPEAIVDAATRSHPRALLVLVTAALMSFLPGFFGIPPVDRDEARFAQSTKQMIETGDYIDIRFQDDARFKKPIGIYWLQAAVVHTARAGGVGHALTTIWLYRVPSLAGAIGAVCLTYWAALALVSRRGAVLAALMMACCVLLGIEARLATTDAMLLLTTVAAMGGLARLYLAAHGRPLSAPEGWAAAAVVWTALAFGVLLKGPVIVLVAGLCGATLAIRDRSVRWLIGLRPVAGLIWFTALTLPWFLLIDTRSGGAFTEGWANDIIPKIVHGMEGHGAPPGYYVVLFWVTFWPGSALAGLAAPGVFAARRAPATAFLLAWLVPAWIFFELATTKLPHYVLPLYPSVAILIAGIVDTRRLSRRPWLMGGAMWGAVFPLIVGALSIAALMVIGRQSGLAAWPLIGAAVLTAFVGWRRLAAGGEERALVYSVVAACLLSGAVLGVIAPRLRPLFPSATIAELLSASGCAQPQVVTSLTYDEPSLVFLAGTVTRATNAAGAVAFVGGGPCRFALVDETDADHFRRHAEASHVRYLPHRPVEGINISKGTAVRLATFWSGGPP